ncbi:MAG: imipenem/basic amino acid-specific outer membrane pore, partial [Sulfurimonas sp.]
MKKIVLSMAVIATSMVLQAADTSIISGGIVSGEVKVMHIISDNDNGWTPYTGSGYLGKIKYVTPEILDGLKLGAAFYINGGTGFTDWDGGYKTAGGMFVAANGEEVSQLGEAYLEYKSDMVNAKAGRQILKTPLTQIKTSLMPNFYEAYMLDTNIVPGFAFNLGQITNRSYGSRSATDYALIGEKTGTAGVVQKMNTTINQAEFVSIAEGAGEFNEKTNGITVVGATYKGVENLKVSIWDYQAWDIVNNLYAEVEY